MYFEDEQGTKLSRLRPNTEVTLVIKSTAMDGKSIGVDLMKHKVGFKHNGVVLENNLLEDIFISGDTKRMRLTTIKK